MKRLIKFKAITLKGNKWVYGSYIESDIDAPCIIFGDGEQIEIKPETLCQFVGLFDIKGKELYEGDIVHQNGCHIVWSDRLLCWCFKHVNDSHETPIFHQAESFKTIEILGNILEKSFKIKH